MDNGMMKVAFPCADGKRLKSDYANVAEVSTECNYNGGSTTALTAPPVEDCIACMWR